MFTWFITACVTIKLCIQCSSSPISSSHLVASAHRELSVKGSSQDVAQVERKSLMYICFFFFSLNTPSCNIIQSVNPYHPKHIRIITINGLQFGCPCQPLQWIKDFLAQVWIALWQIQRLFCGTKLEESVPPPAQIELFPDTVTYSII